MNHEIEVSNLMFNKTSDEQIDFKKYDINVELEEESSNEEKTVLKYSLDLTSNPKNSVINISGNTVLFGEQSEIEELLKQDNEKTPEVVSLIYQELFPLMYIISKNMKIPSPAHTISQNNVNEFEEKSETEDKKTGENENKGNSEAIDEKNENSESTNEIKEILNESQVSETNNKTESTAEENSNDENK